MLITVSEILEKSWAVFKKNWRSLIVYMAFIFIPTLAISLLGLAGVMLDTAMPSSILASNITIMALLVAGALFSLWTTLALTVALNHYLKGEVCPAWREIYSQIAPKIWPFIFTTVLAGLIVVGGTILLIVPGIIFAIWYTFITYSIILENKQGLAALQHSKQLVAGRWFAILWRLLAPGVIFALITAILHFALVYPATYFIKSDVLSRLTDNILTALISAIVAPAATIAGLALYRSALETPVALPDSTPVVK